MKWLNRSEKPDDSTLVIELTHPSGSVAFVDPLVRSKGDGVTLRAIVDAATWSRICQNDIFGASTRTRQQGPLPDDSPLRITVFTETELPDQPRIMPAEQFVIVDAMHQVDPGELAAAGLEGEVWEGIAFSEPKPWSLAMVALTELGFMPHNGLPSATTMRHHEDDLSVEFRRNDVANVTHAQVVVALPMGDDVAPATFQLINGINAAVPFSVTMIDAGDLIVRESVADEMGDTAPSLIASRVTVLVDIMTAIRGAVIDVANGESTVADALTTIFG